MERESGHSGRTRAANRVDLHNQRSGANENEMEFSLYIYIYITKVSFLSPRDREMVVYARRWVAKAALINRARELYLTDL